MDDFIIKNGVLTKYKGTDTEVVIPEGVRVIGESAFEYCGDIKSIVIPESVESIGYMAFCGCSGLKSIVIPEGLTDIDSGAFWYCVILESIDIPKSVTSIGIGAFSGCCNLTDIRISKDNPVYSTDGRAIYMGSALMCIPSAWGRIVLQQGLTGIMPRAFYDCQFIEYMELPESIEVLEHGAFKCCEASIYAPSISLSSLKDPDLRFKFVMGFAEKYVSGEKIREDRKAEYRKYIKGQRKRFYDTALKKTALLRYMICENIIPKEDIEAVADKVQNADAETKAMLLTYQNKILTPEVREKMEEKKINTLITGTLTVTAAKKQWKYEKGQDGIRLTGYKDKDRDVIVPHIIGKDKVTEIGDGVFSPEALRITSDVQESREQITSVALSENIKKIGDRAFAGCSNITDIVIPGGVKVIGKEAFSDCCGLTSIDMPEELEEIGMRAFFNCSSLKSIVIPKKVKKIEEDTFLDCKRLKRIVIPEGVSEMGRKIFTHCSKKLVICGREGSFAEEYAHEHKITFEAL